MFNVCGFSICAISISPKAVLLITSVFVPTFLKASTAAGLLLHWSLLALSHNGTGRVTSSGGAESLQCSAYVRIQFVGTLVIKDDTPVTAGDSVEK